MANTLIHCMLSGICRHILDIYPELKQYGVPKFERAAMVRYLPVAYETRLTEYGTPYFANDCSNVYVSEEHNGHVNVCGVPPCLMFGYRYGDWIVIQFAYNDIPWKYVKCRYSENVFLRCVHVMNKRWARLARRGLIPKRFNDCCGFNVFGEPVNVDGIVLQHAPGAPILEGT